MFIGHTIGHLPGLLEFEWVRQSITRLAAPIFVILHLYFSKRNGSLGRWKWKLVLWDLGIVFGTLIFYIPDGMTILTTLAIGTLFCVKDFPKMGLWGLALCSSLDLGNFGFDYNPFWIVGIYLAMEEKTIYSQCEKMLIIGILSGTISALWYGPQSFYHMQVLTWLASPIALVIFNHVLHLNVKWPVCPRWIQKYALHIYCGHILILRGVFYSNSQ